jgi:hypothetical protein
MTIHENQLKSIDSIKIDEHQQESMNKSKSMKIDEN